jgi:hypothetical protein
VLLGVSLADRSGGRKLLRRITTALTVFEGLRGQFAKAPARGVPAGDIPFDDELDDEAEDLDSEYAGMDEELQPAYDAADDEDDFEDEYVDGDFEDEEENEGTGFEPAHAGDYIDERVLAAFEQDPILAERDIEIDEPEPAVISLKGRVATPDDAKYAATIARGVPGVERVENYLKIRNLAPVSPPPEDPDA